MANRDEGKGVLGRVMRMVGTPARNSRTGFGSESGLSQFADAEKAELKAMIERKRRNDFVRRRELNMLRRIRREGLSPEQAATLEANSHLDDSDRATHPPGGPDSSVKAKIDAIEQQMVGSTAVGRAAPARRAALDGGASTTMSIPESAPTVPAGLVHEPLDAGTRPMMMAPADFLEAPARAAPPTLTESIPSGLITGLQFSATEPLPQVEVSVAVHDHELDEAVIAFANADFGHAERALEHLVKGTRADHSETWLCLFDLYRATGQQQRFDNLAHDYRQHFQTSPPQWYSLPRLVADASSSGMLYATEGEPDVGWICPAHLDNDGVSDLASRALQLPQPWVLDWTALQRIDPDAVNRLLSLLRQWAEQPLEMRWLSSDRLFLVLQESAPVGMRDADPGYWLTRLEALRLTNRPDQFDEVAIDYCVTYEVSPPSWAAARGVARCGSSTLNTRSSSLSVVGEATTVHGGESSGASITSLDLSGQLSGDISAVLRSLDAKLGGAQVIRVSCALLIRVDFLAGGDLLNWILSRKSEGRHISFVDVHRLVAAMFTAMGISEHAPVHLRHA